MRASFAYFCCVRIAPTEKLPTTGSRTQADTREPTEDKAHRFGTLTGADSKPLVTAEQMEITCLRA